MIPILNRLKVIEKRTNSKLVKSARSEAEIPSGLRIDECLGFLNPKHQPFPASQFVVHDASTFRSFFTAKS